MSLLSLHILFISNLFNITLDFLYTYIIIILMDTVFIYLIIFFIKIKIIIINIMY